MSRRRRASLALIALALVVCTARTARAQDIAGDWQGVFKVGADLRVVVHITGAAGSLGGSLDSPDQGARGIPLTAVALTGTTLTFSVPAVGGSYTGVVTPQGPINGTWTQGGRAVPLVLSRVTDPASLQVRRPQTPAPPYPYREEDVSYDGGAPGVRLSGTLTIPAGSGRFPAVVLITGSGPQDRDETLLEHKPFKVLADHLTRRGVAVLRADDRGVGKSTGSFQTATTQDFAADAEASLAFLATRPEVDKTKLGLVGHSEGGVIAPMIAARNPTVAFVVLMAGAGTPGDELLIAQTTSLAAANGAPPDLVQRAAVAMRQMFATLKEEKDPAVLQARLREQLKAFTQEPQIPAQIATLTSPWYRYFLAYDPAPALRAVKVPVLALGGEKDLQVPAKVNLAAIRAALEAGGNTRVQVEELPGLNHLFQHAGTGSPAEYGRIEETIAPEVLEKITTWITTVAAR